MASLQELDVHFRAVNPDKLATAIGEAGGGKQQKELLEVQALDRAFDREHGVVVGDRVELTIPAPSPINGHDADVIATAEGHALQTLAIFCHVQIPAIAATFGVIAAKAGVLTGAWRTSLG